MTDKPFKGTQKPVVLNSMWSALLVVSLSLLPRLAEAQNTDCNALARDLVTRNFQSSWSDYSKLLFLTSLTQMDLNSSTEALQHSGKVRVGPISIGPGTWNRDRQDQLRRELQQFVNIEQLRQSAASVSMTSGDPSMARAVENCLLANGGLYLALNDLGKTIAVAEVMWTSFPGQPTTAVMDSVTVVHGKIIGGESWAERGARLNERLKQRIIIERNDPKQDLAVIVNTANAGSGQGYLPPSELPPPPPPTVLKVPIEGNEVSAFAGGGGEPNPGCPDRTFDSCVKPTHGGKIVPGSGQPRIVNQTDMTWTSNPRESPEQYCVAFLATTGACETQKRITGLATAVEEYTADE